MADLANSKITIIVADDDKALSDLLSIAIKDAGFNVKRVTTGAETLGAVEAERPQLLILDYELPDMNGVEVLRSLRKSDYAKNLPVILASNIYEVSIMNEVMALGVHDYVIKSDMSLDAIIAMISSYVAVAADA